MDDDDLPGRPDPDEDPIGRPAGVPGTRGPATPPGPGRPSAPPPGAAEVGGVDVGSTPRIGSVDSGVYAPAGQRPPLVLLAGTGLAVLAALLVLISAATASSDGFGGISRFLSATIGIALLAGAVLLPLGRARARLVVYAVCAVLIVENISTLGDSAVNVLSLLHAVAIVACLSVPESNAFFRARYRRR